MLNQKNKVSLRSILKFALPMMVSQATETIMLFTDRYFLSLLGKNYLSAAMSGGLSSFVFSSLFIGIIGYANALVAQYFGAGQRKNCLKSTGQAFWLSICFYPLALALIPVVYAFFKWTGHSPLQLKLEFSYFRILMMGCVFGFIRSAVGAYFLGTGRTAVVMTANLMGMVINIPLNYCFIFGAFGLPAMGIEGAALGTLGGSLFSACFLLIAYRKAVIKQKKTVDTRGIWKWDSFLMKKLLKYGLPAGGELFINVFLFNFFIQLMFSYNDNVAAATTITFNYDLLAFIPMMGLSFAITAMTGQQMGAGSVPGVKRVTILGLRITYIYAAAMMIIFLAGAGWLVRVFAQGFAAEDHQAIIPMATTMLRLAAIYLLADATQLIFAGTLRGTGDTRWVMCISIGLHTIMAVGTYLMIKVLRVSPLTVWLYFIGFVLALGVAMALRYFTGKWKKIRMIEPVNSNSKCD